jgi:aryl-alcohol dehydrogenase-like predicted oxidoreductase
MMTTSRIVLGLWPIAGITTVGVTAKDAWETVAQAIELGITRFDTAYSYGYEGESDRLLGQFIGEDRERYFVIGKVGQRWNAQRQRVIDGTPEQLTADAEASLRRIGTDYFDLLLLHSPDPNVPIGQSAAAIERLRRRGLCNAVGISNADVATVNAFGEVAKLNAIEAPLNWVQRDSLSTTIGDSYHRGREVYVYWTLMKGLLAGKISRDHVFAAGDSRPGYPIFQGQLRASIHDALDDVAELARETGKTVAQLSIGWAISQPEVTAALVGARRPDQVREIAAVKPLDAETVRSIDRIAARHVPPQ